MSPERFEEIKQMIKGSFGILETEVEAISNDERGGQIDRVIFNGPLGKMKMEFVTRPRVIGKKTLYSKRAGAASKVEYQYSEDEMVNTLFVYKWDDNNENWVKIEAGSLGLG